MNHSPTSFNERILLTIFALFGVPASMLDVGCGDGTMLRLAAALGVYAVGIDVVAPPDVGRARFIQHDLRQRLDLGRIDIPDQFDLVLCLETAEHIEAKHADDLVWTIARHSAINGKLVFSAAMPGQGGEGHVNLQPPVYWRDKLWATGHFSYRPDQTAQLALLLSYTAGPMANWVPASIQVF